MTAKAGEFPTSEAQLRDRVLTIIKASLPRKPYVKDVAARLDLSEWEFYHKLKRENITFRELITQAQQELCPALLLDTTMSLAEVARALGFWDPNTFYRAFRTWHGMTPRQWTELHKAESENGVVDHKSSARPPSQNYRGAVYARKKLLFNVVRQLDAISESNHSRSTPSGGKTADSEV